MTLLLRVHALGLLGCLAAAPLAAQQDHWARQVDGAFRRADTALVATGLRRVGPVRHGLLFDGERVWLPLALPAGGAYAIVAACDQDCARLGLVLGNGTGYDLAADPGRGNAPIVRLSAARAAEYRVRVIMGACRLSPCRFGVAVYAEPASMRSGP